MGGAIGARLVRSGIDVLFVDRVTEHVEAINTAGLTVTGPVASFRVAATAALPDEVRGAFQTILLCVKAHHTREALGKLKEHVAEAGAVVSIQNGLNEGVIAEAVGWQRTVGAFVNFGADYLEPGVIHWGGRGAVVVGEPDGSIADVLEAPAHRGVLVEVGEEVGVATPLTRRLVALIHDLEEGRRQRGWSNLDDLGSSPADESQP